MAVSKRMWLREQERKKRERQRRARRRRNFALLMILSAVLAVTVIVTRSFWGEKKPAVDDNIQVTEQVPETSPQAVNNNSTMKAAPQNINPNNAGVNAEFFDNSVFLGNAVSEGIKLYGLLPYTDFYSGITITVENVGTTAGADGSTAVLDLLKSRKVRKVFLTFGELELPAENTKQFINAYQDVLSKVKSYQRSANIYLISIPPVAETAATAGSGMSLRNIRSYNRAIKQLAAKEKVYYVDSFNALGGNYLPPGVSADGINLNRDYYCRLLNYIEKKAYIPDITNLDAEGDAEDEDTYDDTGYDDYDSEDEASDDAQDAAYDEDSTYEEAAVTEQPEVNVLKDRGR